MATKKYDFRKILAEYSIKYKKKYILNLKIDEATIIHRIDRDVFDVEYICDSTTTKHKIGLVDFLYYNVDDNISISKMKGIIRDKEESNLGLKIEIWPPTKIHYAYLENNYYAKGKGDLGKSCMRVKTMQKALNFYTKNNVKIVVMVDSNHKIHARALLWENVKYTQRKTALTYLDRVYARSEHLVPPFYELAGRSKWKMYGFTSPDKAKGGYYIENIDVFGMCHLPWVDTFKYLYLKSNLIASSEIKCPCKFLSLRYDPIRRNDGYFSELDPNRVKEVFSHEYISKKDAVFVKQYNGFVLKKNIANIKGVYYSIHDEKIVKSKLDKYILRKYAVEEVFTNELIDITKALHSIKHDGYIHLSNAVHIRGEVYHENDPDITCFKDKWYHISQCFANYGRKEINKELQKPVCTPGGNKEFVKQPMFFDEDLPKNYMRYLTLMWSFCREKGPTITREDGLIPKEQAIVAYNLTHNEALDNIEYQEVYCITKRGLIQLVTGELIVDSSTNREYLKKFNGKYYIKEKFKLQDKNQLMLWG